MEQYKPYLEWLNGQQKEMIDHLKDWSAINSGTYNLQGIEEQAKKLLHAFQTLGGRQTTISLVPNKIMGSLGQWHEKPLGKLLHIQKHPYAPVRVLLCGHMDTVFSQDHSFQALAAESENKLVGPGVADMKGGLLVMLYALKAFERSPYAENLGWDVLITPDEEIGSPGSSPYLAKYAKKNNLGLVFEPAMDEMGTLVSSRKGSGKFSIVLTGVSAHAGRDFSAGKNAIVALADLILKIADLNGKRDQVTINVGKIEGGGALNIVPDLALAHIDVRIRNNADKEWIMENFTNLINEVNTREGFHAEIYGGFVRMPKEFNERTQKIFHQLKNIGHCLNLELAWKESGGVSDANNLSAAGLSTIDTLGVIGGKIHTDKEYILLDSLVTRAKLTALILFSVAAGDLVL